VQSSKTVQDGSGRVTIVETDDRGEPEFIALATALDFKNQPNYVELVSFPLNRGDWTGKGSGRIGLLMFSANVNQGGNGADYVLLDCIVYGYIGSAPTVIKRMAFGPNAPDDFMRLDDSNNYDKVGIAGRQIVNGRPDSTTTLVSLSLTVSGRISR
jgi:hypothetical protein